MELIDWCQGYKRMLRKSRDLTTLYMWVGTMGISEIFGQEESQKSEKSRSGNAGISGNAVQ